MALKTAGILTTTAFAAAAFAAPALAQEANTTNNAICTSVAECQQVWKDWFNSLNNSGTSTYGYGSSSNDQRSGPINIEPGGGGEPGPNAGGNVSGGQAPSGDSEGPGNSTGTGDGLGFNKYGVDDTVKFAAREQRGLAIG